jgi:hypothetical protein
MYSQGVVTLQLDLPSTTIQEQNIDQNKENIALQKIRNIVSIISNTTQIKSPQHNKEDNLDSLSHAQSIVV